MVLITDISLYLNKVFQTFPHGTFRYRCSLIVSFKSSYF